MKIESSARLSRFNSFGFHAVAEEFASVRSVAELKQALDTDKPVTILGGGSNVVMKQYIPGRVVHLSMDTISVKEQANGTYLVHAESGRNWNDLVRYTLGNGIVGLENLSLIPGSVGGAPFQNIGAYGVELSEVFHSVNVFDRADQMIKVLKREECDFRYRDSVFKSENRGRYVILGTTLRLGNRPLVTSYEDVKTKVVARSGDQIRAIDISEIVVRIRRKKLPDTRKYGNVGSFFKNPVLQPDQYDALQSSLSIEGRVVDDGIKVSAARLIDHAGWKGHMHGRAQVWPRQPLVLINRGGSSGEEVLALAKQIREDIGCRYGISLELEPQIFGVSDGEYKP